MATLLLLIIYLVFISLGLPDSLLGAAWPVMRHDLGAPLGMAGVLSFTVTIGTIVSALSTSRVVRRIGTANTTLISVALTAGALLGFSAAPSAVWLMLFSIPLGLGGGAIDSALNHYIAAHYAARHMSWLHCFWGVGVTVSPIIMAAYLDEGAWRNGYMTVGLIQTGIVALLLISLPLWKQIGRAGGGQSQEADASAEASGLDKDGGRKPHNAAGIKYALGTFLFYCGVEMTAGLWGSSYLVNAKGISADDAAMWVSIYFAGITIGRLVSGFVTFKYSSKTLIRAGEIITLAGTLLLLLPLPAPFSLAGFLITGLGLAPIFPSMLHETPARFGEAHAGKIMGWQMATAYTGAAVLPPLFGWLAGQVTIGLFPLYLVLMAAAMLLATERLNALLRKRNEAA